MVPNGALESLPIGVLVTAPPTAEPKVPADHRAVAWFARDYAVTVLPSVGSLLALREYAPTAHAASPFVGIGDLCSVGNRGPHAASSSQACTVAHWRMSRRFDSCRLCTRPPKSCALSPGRWGLESRISIWASGRLSHNFAKQGSNGTASLSLPLTV